MRKDAWLFQFMEQPRKMWLIAILIATVVLSVFLISNYQIQPSGKSIPTTPYRSADFAYDSKLFLSAVASANPTIHPNPPKIIVIPHHLTASPLIARGIASLKRENDPESIFIFSPNHSNVGNCDMVTSTDDWSTPFGTVLADKSSIEVIIRSESVCLDNAAFANEHGIAGLLPFIKYYLPNAKIIPVASKKYIDEQNLNIFISSLQLFKDKNFSYISSIDFSHNLSSKEAAIKDSQTMKMISDRDYSQIQKLTETNLDSPSSLIISMKLAEQRGENLEILDHKNSSDYNNSTTSVTSYFFLSSIPSLRSRLGGSGNPGDQPSSRAQLRDLTPPTSRNSSNATTLIFAGDVMLGRTVNSRMQKYKDYKWPFLKTAEVLGDADLTIFNLESPFKSGCTPTDKGMIFCSDPKSIEGLIYSGVDIVSLANNHILNQGKDGLSETISLLNSANISAVGLNEPTYKTIANTKIAFLGFNDIGGSGDQVSSATPDTIIAQISSAKRNADFIVATFHFGNEYSLRSLRQQELARLAIDNGADMVIGHHPHWVQESEVYKGKTIYYSLGNLVFDQMWSLETRKGLIVKFTIQNNEVVETKEIPVLINDYGQPTPVN